MIVSLMKKNVNSVKVENVLPKLVSKLDGQLMKVKSLRLSSIQVIPLFILFFINVFILVGSPMSQYAKGELKKVVQDKNPTVEIFQDSKRYSISFPGTTTMKNNTDGNNCITKIAKNIISPSTWIIKETNRETNLDPKKDKLLVFHLLPLKASRIQKDEVIGGSPDKIECDQLNIKFVRKIKFKNNFFSLPTTMPC
jgi:hypothetical protein